MCPTIRVQKRGSYVNFCGFHNRYVHLHNITVSTAAADIRRAGLGLFLLLLPNFSQPTKEVRGMGKELRDTASANMPMAWPSNKNPTYGIPYLPIIVFKKPSRACIRHMSQALVHIVDTLGRCVLLNCTRRASISEFESLCFSFLLRDSSSKFVRAATSSMPQLAPCPRFTVIYVKLSALSDSCRVPTEVSWQRWQDLALWGRTL